MNATETQVIARLLMVMRLCRKENVRFRECLLLATARFNKENRERALEKIAREEGEP